MHEEQLKKKRYQEFFRVYRTFTCFSISSFTAHKNLKVSIQNERSGV
ncbi:hypothetical protein CSB66_0655 [Enterobacter hormaechei]|nr:hypothetical protein CSC35_3322 [Enterobacter hormaechei]RCG79866.1 hypothetical protein CSB66_0655 [Enterobacter hormaechei]